MISFNFSVDHLLQLHGQSLGSRLAQLAVHQKGRVQGHSGQTFYQCNHEGDVNEAMHIQDQASCSRFAQQVEGDDQLRS